MPTLRYLLNFLRAMIPFISPGAFRNADLRNTTANRGRTMRFDKQSGYRSPRSRDHCVTRCNRLERTIHRLTSRGFSNEQARYVRSAVSVARIINRIISINQISVRPSCASTLRPLERTGHHCKHVNPINSGYGSLTGRFELGRYN